MNSSQFASLARWLLNAISGGVIAYTASKSPAAQSIGAYIANLATGPDALAAVTLGITWLWGHITHAPTDTPNPGNKLPALFLVGSLALALGTGCQSTPQLIAYQSAGTAIVSADTAMQLWGAYVAANHPGTNIEAQVKSAFEKYQASVAVLCDAGAIYSAAGTNTTAAAAFSQATANAGQSLLDLENLLTTVGVKLN